MDTSNSSMDFKVFELKRSDCSEEKALIPKAQNVVKELVSTIRPILKYVCRPIYFTGEDRNRDGCTVSTLGEINAITLSQNSSSDNALLFLGGNGDFFKLVLCTGSKLKHYHLCCLPEDSATECPRTWEQFPFNEVVEGLRNALKEAKERREKHLAAIRERSQKLDEIVAILERPTDERRHDVYSGHGYRK